MGIWLSNETLLSVNQFVMNSLSYFYTIDVNPDINPSARGTLPPYKTDRNQLLQFSSLTDTVEDALTQSE